MLEDKAKDLGRLLGQSAEYQALKRANAAITENRETATVLRRLEELRVEAQAMIERGQEPPESMELELGGLLQQVETNPEYQRAISAQANFDKLMLRVNEWITDGIRSGAASPIITLA
jgi:cell fate (sporulation/competence/biofilm development) regulator YlbF (YheA/YmcA/DUF963 family)